MYCQKSLLNLNIPNEFLRSFKKISYRQTGNVKVLQNLYTYTVILLILLYLTHKFIVSLTENIKTVIYFLFSLFGSKFYNFLIHILAKIRFCIKIYTTFKEGLQQALQNSSFLNSHFFEYYWYFIMVKQNDIALKSKTLVGKNV